MKKIVFTFVLLILVLPWAVRASALDTSNPKKFTDNIANRIIEIINSKKSESDKQEDLVNLFESYVDTDWMARFALGKYYRQLDDKKKTDYLRLYKDYVIYTYVPRFREYSGEKMNVLSSIKQGRGEYIVKSSLKTSKANNDVLVDYRLKKKGSSFKIIDVIGEGVSLITTQRSDFAAPISQRGIDFFLDRLAKKVEMLKSR